MTNQAEPSSAIVEIVARLTRMVADLQTEPIKDAGFNDLSLRQIRFLDLIRELHNPTPSELARLLQITKPSITAVVDRLENLGYIHKVRSDADRRSYHLHLTRKGENFAAAHEDVHRQLALVLTRNLSEGEIQLLIRLVNKILGSSTDQQPISS
jgi:DNA-binding MarR family transcriptional regulator